MIPPVNGMGRLRSFKAIVRPAKSAFQNQTAPSSRMSPSVIDGPGGCLGSLDDFVGAGLNDSRDCYTNPTGSFHIDCKVEFRRKLHRDIARFGSF